MREWLDKKGSEGMGQDNMDQEKRTRKFLDFAQKDVILVPKMDVPMQNNFHDCGLFVLEYISCFLKCYFSRNENNAKLSDFMRLRHASDHKKRSKAVSGIVSAVLCNLRFSLRLNIACTASPSSNHSCRLINKPLTVAVHFILI